MGGRDDLCRWMNECLPPGLIAEEWRLPMPDTKPVRTNKPKTAIHHVKCHPPYFTLVREGKKPFEVRLNDRDYRVGDRLVMHEWDPEVGKEREAEGYTGMDVAGVIECVVGDDSVAGIKSGYVVLGVRWTEGLLPAPRGA